MPLIGLLSIVFQIALGVHAIQTGRDRQWLYILLIPVFGPAVYVITQILPDVFSSSTGRNAARRLVNALDPQRELRKRKEDLERADTVENRRLLADECVEIRYFREAVELYQSCLHGHYEHDASVLQGLAGAQFGLGDFGDSKATLDRLLEHHPDTVSQSGHLLYTRCLEELGDHAKAEQEYDRLLEYATGEEARIRYAQFLKRIGRDDECRTLCEETLRRTRLGGKVYQKAQNEWIQEAKRLSDVV